MADIRDAMKGAGFKGSGRETAQGKGSAPGRPGGDGGAREQPARNPFPAGYPDYFTQDGFTRVDLITREAEALAERFEQERLKRHQLRAFYDHAKRQLQRLVYGAPFGEVHPEIARLKAFAADRAGRAENALPVSFKAFIDRNVDAIRDENSFRKGFMPHFEAVVGYCARIKD